MAANSALRGAQYVAPWWRGGSVFWALMWFILRDFLRSPWLALNMLSLAGVQLFLLGPDPSRSQFFSVVYLVTLLLAGLNTMGIFSRANSAQTYAILARPVSRGNYTTASMLAAWLVSIAGYVVTVVLAYLRFGPQMHQASDPGWFTLSTFLAASIPIVVGVTFAVSLMALLSAFVAPFFVRLGVLAVIVLLVMAFDPRSFPIEAARPLVDKIPPLLGPIAGALRYAIDSPPDAIAIASVIILAAYTTTLLALVLWLSSRREVELD
ncbi:MAG: hypothetical protein ABI670_16755 [Chloroflexota bacterium]